MMCNEPMLFAETEETATFVSDPLTTNCLMSLRRLIEDRCGVTAIEYGLIAALIAVAAVVVMGTVGTNLSGTFSQVAASL